MMCIYKCIIGTLDLHTNKQKKCMCIICIVYVVQ